MFFSHVEDLHAKFHDRVQPSEMTKDISTEDYQSSVSDSARLVQFRRYPSAHFFCHEIQIFGIAVPGTKEERIKKHFSFLGPFQVFWSFVSSLSLYCRWSVKDKTFSLRGHFWGKKGHKYRKKAKGPHPKGQGPKKNPKWSLLSNLVSRGQTMAALAFKHILLNLGYK